MRPFRTACASRSEAAGTLPPMLRRRRLPVAASTLLLCGSLVLSSCANGSGADDDSSSESTSTSASASAEPESSTTEASEDPESPTSDDEEDEEEEAPDPYEISCGLITQDVVDEWVRGGKAASVEGTDRGCRVVSSSKDGAVIIEWRWLNVPGSGGDAGILRKQEQDAQLVTVAHGVPGRRVETDVAPTRNSRVTAKIEDRFLYIETTVTLDRNQTMQDTRRIARTIAETYRDTDPPEPEGP